MRKLVVILLTAVGCMSASSQGLKLFSPEMKASAPKSQVVVMDFLERYFSQLPALKETSVQTKMADDKVYFRKGRPADLALVCDTMSFALNLLDRYYEVSWLKADNPFITIVFPAQYELLLGMRKDEALKHFKDMIVSAPQRRDSAEVPSGLVQIDSTVYKTDGDSLELASLTDALYYNKVCESFLPVFDKEHLDFSAANLFHGLIPDADFRLYIEQSVYGMTTIDYTIQLSQWLNFCAEWGMKVFFAVEEQREDGILALVIAQNKALGCHHLLSVVIPDKFVDNRNTVLKAKLTPFIPTHNVKDLYQQFSTNHKKVRWR